MKSNPKREGCISKLLHLKKSERAQINNLIMYLKFWKNKDNPN